MVYSFNKTKFFQSRSVYVTLGVEVQGRVVQKPVNANLGLNVT